MPQYLVERHLPGITEAQLGAAAARARSTAAALSQEGTPVRYLRSTFVPMEEKCYCLFEGASAEAVERAQVRAELPFDRMVEAGRLAAEDLG